MSTVEPAVMEKFAACTEAGPLAAPMCMNAPLSIWISPLEVSRKPLVASVGCAMTPFPAITPPAVGELALSR